MLRGYVTLNASFQASYLLIIYLSGYYTHKSIRCGTTGTYKKVEEPQICTDCGKVLSSKAIFKLHVQRIHGNNKSHDCDECSKSFANKTDLKGHINQSHSRKTCEQCGKSVLNKFFLKKHLVFDHGITDGAFICDVCPKTMFSSETGYKKHVNEKHNHSE